MAQIGLAFTRVIVHQLILVSIFKHTTFWDTILTYVFCSQLDNTDDDSSLQLGKNLKLLLAIDKTTYPPVQEIGMGYVHRL